MTPIDPIFFSTPWYRRPIAAVVALVVLVGAVFLFANSGRERGPREAVRTASRTPAADSAANADSSAAADSADTDDTSDVTLPVPEHARRGAAAPKSIVLTRADSEAIAEAVRKRMEARGAPAKADTQQNGAVVVRIPPESIAVVFQRSINDSVKEVLKRLQMQQVERMPEMRDLRGMAGQSGRDDPLARMRELARHPERVTPVAPIVTPPTGGERRIVVMPFQIALRDRSRDSLGIVLADGVRNAITQRARDLDVVDAATTMEAARITHNQIALGWTLRADHVLSGTLVQRDDSLYLTALLTDVRNGRVIGVARAGAAATDDPTVLIPQLGDRAVALIRRAESMPVAPPVPPSPRP
jgi:TolB-like protein